MRQIHDYMVKKAEVDKPLPTAPRGLAFVHVMCTGICFSALIALAAWTSDLSKQNAHLQHQILAVSLKRDKIAHREKRGSEQYDDTYHELLYHHGIHNSGIAHYYGDVHGLRHISGNDDNLFFAERQTPSHKHIHCSRIMSNGYMQGWCGPSHYNKEKGVETRFFTSANLTTYPYFTPAPWMHDTPAHKANFVMEKNGWIHIMRNGMYLVYANIQFEKGSAGFYAMKVESGEGSLESISSCTVSGHQGSWPYEHSSCATQLPVMLRTGDRVAMSIKPYALFRLKKESFYFGLIKLNDNGI